MKFDKQTRIARMRVEHEVSTEMVAVALYLEEDEHKNPDDWFNLSLVSRDWCESVVRDYLEVDGSDVLTNPSHLHDMRDDDGKVHSVANRIKAIQRRVEEVYGL